MPSAKSYEFDLNGLPVHITRRHTSHITLRVLPDRTLSLSAPLSATKRSLAEFLYSHERHANDLLQDYEDHHDPALPRLQHAFSHLEPQEEVVWWGQPLSVVWSPTPVPILRSSASPTEKPLSPDHENPSRAGISVDELRGQVIFWGPAAQEGSEARVLRQKLLRVELSAALSSAASRRIPQVESALGVTVESLSFRAMTSRWGSCRYEKGRISLNLDLATHELSALEMVLWHEACHLRVPNHGWEFKNLLSSVYPQWKTVSDQLDYEGMRLPKSIAR